MLTHGGASMKRITRQADYGVRVLLALAKRDKDSDRHIPTRLIQREMHIPSAFLKRVVAQLAAAGFVETKAGPRGGLALARPAETITLRQIVEAVEGPQYLSDCLCGPDVCPLGRRCPVRMQWARIQAVMLREMERVTLATLALQARAIDRLGFLPASLSPEKQGLLPKVRSGD